MLRREQKQKTMRVYTEDDRRVHLLAAIRGERPVDFVHDALDFYVASHREALSLEFSRAQRAVLSGDRLALAELFLEGVPEQVDEDMSYLDSLGRD